MISVIGLNKNFGKKSVLKNITFSANPGQITGLIGPNGSGKTTFMRIASTVMDYNSGTVEINGLVVNSKNAREVRKKIGVLFGGDSTLYGNLTARENIMYFGRLYGMDKFIAKIRTERIARELNMVEYLDVKADKLSRGMRQKVCFARAIIHNPDILLLDEPSTGIDINAIMDLQKFILRCKENGKTILLTSHNAQEIDALCDKIVILNKGNIVCNCSKKHFNEVMKSNDMMRNISIVIKGTENQI